MTTKNIIRRLWGMALECLIIGLGAVLVVRIIWSYLGLG